MAKTKTERGPVRKNFRMPADLDDWVSDYAKENNTTMTRLIIDYLTGLRKQVEEENRLRVEQM